MTNISKIASYGRASFAKALRDRPQLRRRKAVGHLAFTITSSHSRHIVRLMIESGKALAECVRADSGEPCKGLSRAAHCYHVSRALLSVTRAARLNPVEKS